MVGYEVFTYDRLNELTSYKNSKGTTAAYKYLPNHYRMSKTVDGVLTQQIWDGDNIVAEANDANAILRSYTWGHQLLTDDDRRAYMYDGHGNVVQQNRGTTAESITRYDAYGNKVESSNVNDVPFGYCGEYLESESGLIYLRNRYYDSESGRFITEDPIRDGVNWYSYCGGNPVMFCDPFGLEYDSLRNLTDSVEEALDTKATISIYKGNVTVGFYKDGYNYRGTFKCDGIAIIDGNTKKIADNKDGHLYMERTDYYDVMGIKHESSMTTQSNKGVIKKGVSLFVGAITGALVSTLIEDVKTGAVVGVIVNEATAKIIDYTMEDKGTYKKITIVGEVYNSETGLYESIVTKDDYKIGPNNGKNVYYRYSLTTEKDSYTYSKSIFDNSIN